MREKIEAIQSLLAAAREENEYGGSEDSEGSLHPGDIDWDVLEERIICVLEDREYVAPEPYTPSKPEPNDPGTTWVDINSLPIRKE